jgi:F-type H+-transporting ATPase subunit gamma
MYLVAAARVRRAQDRLLAARPYAHRMGETLRHVASRVDRSIHPLLAEREVEKTCLIVVSSDRGLCGSFNGQLFRRATQHTSDYQDAPYEMVCVGRKGKDFFRKRDYPVVRDYDGVFQQLTYSAASAIAEDVIRRFVDGEVDRVQVLYNEFKSVIQQEIVVEQLLPIQAEAPQGDPHFLDFIYEPEPAKLMDLLVPRHLHFQMWRILLESNAAEQGARMTAMDNATKNAGELIDELNQELNKARQTAITLELMDIVGGAEALGA